MKNIFTFGFAAFLLLAYETNFSLVKGSVSAKDYPEIYKALNKVLNNPPERETNRSRPFLHYPEGSVPTCLLSTIAVKQPALIKEHPILQDLLIETFSILGGGLKFLLFVGIDTDPLPDLVDRGENDNRVALLIICSKPSKVLEVSQKLNTRIDKDMAKDGIEGIEAQILRGLQLLKGKGVEKDLEMGLNILQAVASKGYAFADFCLSLDPEGPIKWGHPACIDSPEHFTKAAEGGMMLAKVHWLLKFSEPFWGPNNFGRCFNKDAKRFSRQHKIIQYGIETALLGGFNNLVDSPQIIFSGNSELNEFLELKIEWNDCASNNIHQPNFEFFEAIKSFDIETSKLRQPLKKCIQSVYSDLDTFKSLLGFLNKPGFLLTCIRPAEKYFPMLIDVEVDKRAIDLIDVRGKAFFCVLHDNIKAARQLLELLPKMREHPKLDALIMALGMQDGFGETVSKLTEIKTKLQSECDHIYEIIETQYSHRNAIFIEGMGLHLYNEMKKWDPQSEEPQEMPDLESDSY